MTLTHAVVGGVYAVTMAVSAGVFWWLWHGGQ